MSQTDLNLANQARTAFRAELNTHLAALATCNSGPTAPATTFPFMLWLDTGVTPNVMRQRNAANTAWVGQFLDLATTGDMSAGTAGKIADAAKVKAYVAAQVATLDVATSIAGMALGGIGTFVFAGFGGFGLNYGDYVFGSSLSPGGIWKGSSSGTNNSPSSDNGDAWMNAQAVTLAGTWRCMGSIRNGGWSMSLFVRVL